MSKEKQIEKLRGLLWLNPYVTLGSHNAHMLAQYLVNEGYNRLSPWISVGDKLPEEVYGRHRKRISVLVCTESGKISTASRQRAVHFDKTKLAWVELDTFDWSGRKHITHWMPLPEPPEMKGGADVGGEK